MGAKKQKRRVKNNQFAVSIVVGCHPDPEERFTSLFWSVAVFFLGLSYGLDFYGVYDEVLGLFHVLLACGFLSYSGLQKGIQVDSLGSI